MQIKTEKRINKNKNKIKKIPQLYSFYFEENEILVLDQLEMYEFFKVN